MTLLMLGVFILFLFGGTAKGLAQNVDSLLQEYDSYPNDTSKVSLLYKKGFALRNSDLGGAIKFSEACCRAAVLVKDHKYILQALKLRGTLKAMTGNYKKAAVDFTRALLLAIQIRDTLKQIAVLNNLGNVYTELKLVDSANTCFSRALELAAVLENDYWVKGNLLGIATLQFKCKEYGLARENFTTLAHMCNLKNEQEIAAICDLNLSVCNLYTGDTIAAEAYSLQALDELQMMDDTLGMCDAYANMAEICFAKKEYKTCLTYLNAALSVAQKNNYAEALLKTWKVFSDYYKETNDNKLALFYLAKNDSATAAAGFAREKKPEQWKEENDEYPESDQQTESLSKFRIFAALFLLCLFLTLVLMLRPNEQKK